MTTLADDAAALAALKQAAARHAEAAKEAKLEADAAEHLLFERMETEKVGSIRIDGMGNFVRAETCYGQVQDSDELERWAVENMPELFEPKPRKKLINELVRERLDAGEALPPGLGFYTDTYVSVRAA